MNSRGSEGSVPTYIDSPTAADYAAAARDALLRRDWRLAMEQASAAVALGPQDEAHVRLLDEVIATTPEPIRLVALPPSGAFCGLSAARARVLARLGRIDEAVDFLFLAATFRPDSPFLPWASVWVGRAKDAERVRPEALALAMVKLAQAASKTSLDEGVRSNLQAALAIAEKVEAVHPPEVSLRVACSRVLRLLDRRDEALSRLEVGGGSTSWAIAVERAAIHGERAEPRERIEWLQRAREARPSEPSTYLDLGDAQLDDGALEGAIDAYEGALRLEPSSDWALASLAYARALSTGIGEVALPASTSPARQRALLLQADLTAYVTRLADPTDPIIGIIRSVRSRAAQVHASAPLRYRVRTERALAPSASVAFAHELARLGRTGTLSAEHDLATVQLGLLWRRALEAEPAVLRPPDAVMSGVLAVARGPFNWAGWCAHAAEESARLGSEHAQDLLHAMAYPPPPLSDEIDVSLWVHGWQIAAAIMVALGPRPAAARYAALEPLLTGIDDWSASAALLGLRALVAAEPSLQEQALAHARALLPGDDVPLPPLARALAVVGCDLSAGEQQRSFLRLRARVRSELADDPSAGERCEDAATT